MICISVTPESRRLAKVDLLNASRNCDIIELCLDKLIKAPDVGEMISDFKAKPIIVSCRRPQDGGAWEGTEDDRINLLRSAIVAGPAYVELDIDTARRVPRFGEVKRVVSYTSLEKPLADVNSIFAQAAEVKADVVKFVWPTPAIEEAWPLLVAVSKKSNLPTVGVGLGRSGLTFSLLGQRYGSPWVYAALERGMEAHPDQPTVWDLHEIYGLDKVASGTRFVGISGFGPIEPRLARCLNTAFDEVGAKLRCLPMTFRGIEKMESILKTLKINAVLIGPHHGLELMEFAKDAEESAQKTGYIDLLLNQPAGWHGYNTMARSAIRAIEAKLAETNTAEHPLHRRNVILIGAGQFSRAVAHAVHARNGVLSICSPDDQAAQQAAELNDARFVPFANLYTTLADVVLLAEPQMPIGHRKNEFNPSYLKETMTVLDLTQYPSSSGIEKEARERHCKIIDPVEVALDQFQIQFKAITGKPLPDRERRAAILRGEE